MSDNEKITLLSRQLKEVQSTLSGLQQLVANGNIAISNEISDLKSEQLKLQQIINKLSGEVKLVNAEGKLKTSYKDYSNEEIYLMHNNQHKSWADIAGLIGCSKSTVIRKYKEYMYNGMEV